ncbi:uncharacterized protein EV420DRAFT_1487005 [Desarmillaria tabescens]|uniref:Uncharacterized protein n=1 Tax=Armillaria tabescens TaxID=1929756 RepID=A0AA39JBN1_ARMTA|nr:uncharacterized protein EV420DRAFT_1487005 [Desarmillaria tabescens]KAK0437728.1 hypothetical protein EV420DRAFT_1487005 [Desarmillaria tabescens]
MDFHVIGGQLCVKTFLATWSIKHMSNKGISLDHSDSYSDMIEQASKLTQKQVEVILEITQVEDDSNRHAMADNEIEQEPSHGDGHPKKRQKTQQNANLHKHTASSPLSVSIILPGLGDVLGICSALELAPTWAMPLAEISTNILAAKISLNEFCTCDDLLTEKVKLDLAEIGDIHDAQERWSWEYNLDVDDLIMKKACSIGL